MPYGDACFLSVNVLGTLIFKNYNERVLIMALIKCPECGKEISDKSHQCIHCGFPLDEIVNTPQKAEKYYKVVLEDVSPKNKVRIIKIIMDYTGIRLTEAKEMADTLPSIIKNGITLEEAQLIATSLMQENAKVTISDSDNDMLDDSNYINRIVCPKCHSTLVSTGSRGFSLLTGFWGSGKTVNRCGKCGYKWTPKK
ncbi:MAG: ribosomal protein L7/L12 [Oscillospiraceae bacterium]|nr:ribosomal protein L7/L12 [Oscillospiraceae bacterium]